jgi:urease accessory protein
MNRTSIRRSLLALLTLLPSVAYAHTQQSADGFVSGILHPLLGGDHFLAMVSVGIVSAQLGGRRIWTVPTTFVLAMIAGAVAGVYGQAWPLAEQGIALSVIVLGLAITTVSHRVTSWPVLFVVALFGALHGHAHGLELPRSADPIYYGAGFLTSTTAIHLLGVGIGHIATQRSHYVPVLRHLGSAMAGMGLMILTSRVAA